MYTLLIRLLNICPLWLLYLQIVGHGWIQSGQYEYFRCEIPQQIRRTGLQVRSVEGLKTCRILSISFLARVGVIISMSLNLQFHEDWPLEGSTWTMPQVVFRGLMITFENEVSEPKTTLQFVNRAV